MGGVLGSQRGGRVKDKDGVIERKSDRVMERGKGERFSMYSKLREPVNGLTHLGAAVAALVGLGVLLVLGRERVLTQVSLLVYGASLVLMFAASGIYHSVDARPKVMAVLRKVDHSAIYLLIAGTYTPICLRFLTGAWQWGLLALIWTLAFVGIGVKVFVINAPRWITAGVYLLMGWLAVIAVPEIVARVPVGALVGLLAGGVMFTLGAVVYILKKPDFFPEVFGFHEVWHIFVILGCLCHFVVIAVFVAV